MEKQNSYGCERAKTKLSMKGMTITRVILPPEIGYLMIIPTKSSHLSPCGGAGFTNLMDNEIR
jgi:hypothetical protein